MADLGTGEQLSADERIEVEFSEERKVFPIRLDPTRVATKGLLF